MASSDEMEKTRPSPSSDVTTVSPRQEEPDSHDGATSALPREVLDESATGVVPRKVETQTVGSRFGDYELRRLLGRGGQGSVYLARDLRLNRDVALKLLPANLGEKSVARLRFQREAEVASRLQHPSLCTVFETSEFEGVPFIAMQYVEGVTLQELIKTTRDAGDGDSCVCFEGTEFHITMQPKSGRTSALLRSATAERLERAIDFVEQAARALHVAHELGLVHRDIKPANIMVALDRRPVILDFGLARDTESQTETLTAAGDIMGTPAYMSPEQIVRERAAVDRRTDVYSLGVTLYEALTLRRPFEGVTREKLFEAILTREPVDCRKLNPRIPRDLAVVVETALEKDVNRRYQTTLDFAEDLRRVRSFEPIQAAPAGPVLRLSRWWKRNPAIAIFIVTMFFTLSAGLAWTLWKNRQLDSARQRADENARLASLEAEERRRALLEIERLSDVKRLQDLTADAETLWPAAPAEVPRFEAWLSRARDLASRLPVHESALAVLEAGRKKTTSGVAETAGFASVEIEWQHQVLSGLMRDLRLFLEPERGLLARTETRMNFARSVDRLTLEEAKGRWDAAREAVANARFYGGLKLRPVPGLVPLGADPESGLEEFLHLETHVGPLPERDAEGRLAISEDLGIVLVLVPAGSCFTGAQKRDPDEPNYDPHALDEESPRDVDVAAFYLAKFEMTQAQWLRVQPTNPSNYPAGSTLGRETITPRHPVEGLGYEPSARMMGRLGLRLPLDTEWEYACRAGSEDPWHTGADVLSLRGFANLAGPELARLMASEETLDAGFEDGFAVHAPVGTFKANPYGLHDIHGNVREWCHNPKSERQGINRGGSFRDSAFYARSARRQFNPSVRLGPGYGVRAARSLVE